MCKILTYNSPTKWSLCFDAYSKYFAGTPVQKAPQSGAYASMLIPNTLRGPQNKMPHKVEPKLRCLFRILCGDLKTKCPTKWSLCFVAYSKYFAGTPEQNAPQSEARASMLFQVLCGTPKQNAPQSGAYVSLRFAENFKKPPLPGGMLLYK
ncbi:hypothetical protein CPZ30_17275 [Paenibacillus lautus]|nr:hypothetical protein CPZ30_17275 [Paenibacillus lautus]